MARPLNPDELGAKGEKKFGELCLDARVNPNQSDRDRVGWDYVVTWPLAAAAPLDSRPAAVACHVQVKTLWEGNDTVTLNLGTLEHIVKDSRPAFVMVFEVDDLDLSFAGARIIHIAGDFLAECLKRLRQARADGKRPNDLTFQASAARWGTRLSAPSGSAIKAAIEATIPDGMAEYAKAKERELAELGFEKGRMSLRTTIEASSIDEVIDGFLGIQPLRLTEARHFATRFGIAIESNGLPWSQAADGELLLSIKPSKTDECTVTVKRDGDGETVAFKGDLFTLPANLAGAGRTVFEVRGKLLRLRLDARGVDGKSEASIIFGAVPGFDEVAARAAEWTAYYRISAWVMSEPLTVEIKGRRWNAPPPLQGAIVPDPDPAETQRCERAASAAEAVDWALLRAQAPGTRLTYGELLGAADDAALLRTMEQSPGDVTPLTFTLRGPAPAPLEPAYDMLYLNRIPLGAHEIAYAARTRMTTSLDEEGVSWVSGPLQLTIVRKIKPNEAAFRKFVREARKLTGVQNCVGQGDFG